MKMKSKKATSLLYQVIIHLILIALIFGMFLLSASSRVNSKNVKQEVLEKQTALLIDSASPGMTIIIHKFNANGKITKLELKAGEIFAYVDGSGYSSGYPYFTKHSVRLEEDRDNYYIKIEDIRKSLS